MVTIRGVRAANDRSTEQKIVLTLVLVALLVSAISFAGWAFDAPILRTFDVRGYPQGHPIWPLAALSYVFLAAGFAASIRRYRIAPLLLVIPLLIALCAVIEETFAFSPGIDTWLFPEQLGRVAAEHPGRPVANSIVIFSFLGVALFLAQRREWARAELANLLATASFCFGLFSIILLLSIVPAEIPVADVFLSSLPAATINILLASAFLIWRQEAGWTVLLARDRIRRPFVGMTLPLILSLPLLPTFVTWWGQGVLHMTPLGAGALALLCDLLVIGLLFWLSVDRVASQQAALQEVTNALGVAAITLTRPTGEITHWSQGCEQLYGWSSAEAVGHKKYELLHSRHGEQGVDTPLRPTGAAERELLERRRDGSEISVLERTQVLERADREPVFVVKMLDISDRVRAEAALRESETRLAIAAEVQQLGVSHWDIASGRLEWSPGSEQRLGLEPGSLSTFDQWRALVDPKDAEGILDSVGRAAANHEPRIAFQYRFAQADGAIRTIEGSARCLYSASGELEAVVAANIDVTEHKEREAAQQLQSIIETVPDATIVLDGAGSIRSFSAAAERMFGFDCETAIGSNVKLMIPDLMVAGDEDSIDLHLVGARRANDNAHELTARRADGTLFPAELNVGEAWLGQDRIFTAVIRDVSDRRAAEQRLSELSAELAHLSRQSAMSELAADLAHELNQPLSATANFLAAARTLIARGDNGTQVADLLRLGEEQTLRSGEIIRRLRDFLAKREGEMRLESLEHVVREAVQLVLFGTAQFDIRLTYKLDPAADMIFADRIQVQQVLVNLLRNAVDALRGQPAKKREIFIASRAVAEDMTEISVSDNGPGLPEALSEQLYSRFATKKGGAAMGIGLSISRRIVEAHGGTLVAENRPEGGARFRFTLPAPGEIEE